MKSKQTVAKEIVYELRKDELKFIGTCAASPEQYDIFLKDELVAYVRLRWGYLTVDYQKPNGKLIYKHKFNEGKTARWKGSFYTEKEREKYMKIISYKILEFLDGKKQKVSKGNIKEVKV